MARRTLKLEVCKCLFTNPPEWWVRVRGRNGEILFHSENYTRKNSAIRAAERLRAQMLTAEIVVKE
jgi:uncharacterized protein YegP (UPF0339 family)